MQLIWLSDGLYLPAGQLAQAELPALAWNMPAAQAAQAELPALAAYRPALQPAHAVAASSAW